MYIKTFFMLAYRFIPTDSGKYIIPTTKPF